ncbi:MAG: methyltransferase domain-containing protein [Candidatus Eisenbacteria bacterium]|nr:methyltransferase domain-containing protein [Candidatus Eisenbacteria bacterium]
MTPALVQKLRCPRCRSDSPLESTFTALNREEIESGALTCTACREEYAIEEGIADLLGSHSAVVRGERAVYRGSKIQVEDRLRSLDPAARDLELRRIAFMEHTGEQFRLTSSLNLQGVLDRVSPRPGQWLIELGAGSGWLTARWAALGLHCVAVDISADLKLDLSPLVMSREGVFFDRLMADMTNLPIRTGAMDWVFVSASLHHAASLSDSLREAARVLAPEGTLVVIDQAAEETPGLHERSFTYLQWRRALRSAGVRPEFMFPAYYQAILSGTASLPVASRRFAWLAQVAWRSRLRGLLLSRPVQTAARVLLGLNVCMMARKTGDS